jgi:hypothetical protein
LRAVLVDTVFCTTDEELAEWRSLFWRGDAWTEHVATHVDPQTKARLFELAELELTSASAVLRRALAAYLQRADEKEVEP